MDPELNKLLSALVEGQVKLAEGQARADASLAKLAERQDRTEAALAKLTDRISALGDIVSKLASQVAGMGARLDGYTEMVVRGFTDGAGRHGELKSRVSDLEARVSELEKHQKS
ncbi:MAG: hypothetical protein HYZ28_15535 [Myxococcales bacterium]|nr:hypothetical protein [Myxococcales bacterium]